MGKTAYIPFTKKLFRLVLLDSHASIRILSDPAKNGTGTALLVGTGDPSPAAALLASPAAAEVVVRNPGLPGWAGLRVAAKNIQTAAPDPYESTYGLEVDVTAATTGAHDNDALVAGDFMASVNYGDADPVSGTLAALHGAQGAAVSFKTDAGALALGELTGGHFSANNNGTGVSCSEMRGVLGKVAGGSGMTTPLASALYAATPYLTGHTVTDYAGVRVMDQNRGTQTNAAAIYVAAQGYASAVKGNVRMAGGDWSNGHVQMGTGHVWASSDGTVRVKASAPTATGDATLAVTPTGVSVRGPLAVDVNADGTSDYTLGTPSAACASGMEMAVDSTGKVVCQNRPPFVIYPPLGSCDNGGNYTRGAWSTTGAAAVGCEDVRGFYKHPFFQYPDGSSNVMAYTFLAPDNWDGTLTITLWWSGSQTSGAVHWFEGHDCFASGSTFYSQPVTTATVDSTAAGTAYRQTAVTLSVTGLSSCAGGMTTILVGRDGTHANDTYSGAAQVNGVQIALGIK
jgi:hypothetical protein